MHTPEQDRAAGRFNLRKLFARPSPYVPSAAPPPPPMPHVKAAHAHVQQAIEALELARKAWGGVKLEEALQSAEHCIAQARQARDAVRGAMLFASSRQKNLGPCPHCGKLGE